MMISHMWSTRRDKKIVPKSFSQMLQLVNSMEVGTRPVSTSARAVSTGTPLSVTDGGGSVSSTRSGANWGCIGSG